MFQRDPRAGAFLGGDRVSGQDIRDQNGTVTSVFCSNFKAFVNLTHSHRGAIYCQHR